MEPPTNDTPSTVHETADTNATPPMPEEPVSLRQLLARASRVYDITIAAALEEAEMDDLPMRGISVLRRINDGAEGTPLAQVLRGGRISRQHGTQLIDTLVERGYIVRETDPEDRRRMRVSLTERGTAAAEAVRTAIDGLNAALAEQVSPEQIDATRAVLSALVELAPEGAGPERGWGGPERGFFPGERGFGHGRGRGPARGPRGPMRDFDPRHGRGAFGDPRGRGGDRMDAFAAPTGDEDASQAGEIRDFDEQDGPEGRPFGWHDGRERGDHPMCRDGHRHHRHGRGRMEDRSGSPTIVHHVDTLIVNAAPAPEGRGSRRHGGGGGGRDHGLGRSGRPFGPWRNEGDSPAARQPQPQPQPDTPANE